METKLIFDATKPLPPYDHFPKEAQAPGRGSGPIDSDPLHQTVRAIERRRRDYRTTMPPIFHHEVFHELTLACSE